MSVEAPPFWLVWSPTGRTPMFQHPSQDAAVAEADRLSKLNRDQEFFVLQPHMSIVRTDVVRRHFRSDESIPF